MNQTLEEPVHVSEPVEAALAGLDYIAVLHKRKPALDRLLTNHSLHHLVTFIRYGLRSALLQAYPPRRGIGSPGSLPQQRFDEAADWIESEARKKLKPEQQTFEFAE